MPRTVPTYDTMVLGQFEHEPVNMVSEFYDSLVSMDCFIKAPNWDTIDEGCELEYITHFRHDREMKETQNRMLKNQKLQGLRNRNRLNSILQDQRQLRRRFIEVNAFMRDCNEKQLAAENDIQKQLKLEEDLKKKCRVLRSNVQKLTAFRERLKDTVGAYEKYETVLKDLCKNHKLFATVKDCTDRVDALMTAQIQITTLTEEKLIELEQMRVNMTKVTKAAALQALGLKNKLTALERGYDVERHTCLHWQKILAMGKHLVRSHDMGKERIYDCLHFLYRLLCSRRHIDPILQRSQTNAIMDFIREEILFIREVLYECRYGGAPKKTSVVVKYC